MTNNDQVSYTQIDHESMYKELLQELKETIAKTSPDLDEWTIADVVYHKLAGFVEEELVIADEPEAVKAWVSDWQDSLI